MAGIFADKHIGEEPTPWLATLDGKGGHRRLDASLMFLEINGYMLTLANNETLADWIYAVIDGRMTVQEFEVAFKPYVARKRT